MIIELPFKTPTINHLYGQRGVRKFLKPEAKKLREKIKIICLSSLGHGEYDLGRIDKLAVHVKVYEDWYCKNGSVKRKDISNREKFLIDSVFDSLGIDDKLIFKHTMEKIQSDEERCTIEITQHED